MPPVVVAAHQVEDHDVEAPEEEEKDQHGTDGDQTGIQRPLEFRHDDLQGIVMSRFSNNSRIRGKYIDYVNSIGKLRPTAAVPLCMTSIGSDKVTRLLLDFLVDIAPK